MNTRNIIRAWKDEEYRLSLSEAERALLPVHPAGPIELTDMELNSIVGGKYPKSIERADTCSAACLPPPPKRPLPRTKTIILV
jgi:mersacidin/lichenicidin family type 2 lantibiotic